MKLHPDPAAVSEVLALIDRARRSSEGLLEICREILRLRPNLRSIPPEILDPISAVESELDDVPSEESSKAWSPEALADVRTKSDDYLNRVRGVTLNALDRLEKYLLQTTKH